jgi:cell cycle checkpoint protein
LQAQAIIPKSTFESFEYHPPPENDDGAGVSFEIELNSLLTILDIFGAVGTLPAAMSGGKFSTQGRRSNWRDRDEDEPSNVQADTTEAGIARFFATTEKGGKLTGMRMTYLGEGHPLSLTLYVTDELGRPHT